MPVRRNGVCAARGERRVRLLHGATACVGEGRVEAPDSPPGSNSRSVLFRSSAGRVVAMPTTTQCYGRAAARRHGGVVAADLCAS